MASLKAVRRVLRPAYLMVNACYMGAFKLLDPLLVPLENKVLNRILAHRHADSWPAIDGAIERGIRFFESQDSLMFDAVFTFTVPSNETFEPQLARLHGAMRAFVEECQDPHLRFFDRDYDPEDDGDKPRKFDESKLYPVERPVLDCLYADRLGLGEELLPKLTEIEDGGGYGTTHILVGCVLLKRFSDLQDDLLDPIVDRCIRRMVKAQKRSREQDIMMERTVLLQWLGYGDLVKPAWIHRILRGQLRNGGWRPFRTLFSVFLPEAHQHPSSLAISALIQYRDAVYKGGVGERRQLGRAMDLVGRGTVEKTDGGPEHGRAD